MFLLVDLLMAPPGLEVLRTWAIALLAILASGVELLSCVIV